jgi:hypothetical protein
MLEIVMAKKPAKKPAAVAEKRPVGRPSKYKPEYCDQVIEMAKEGIGPAGYAAKFEIAKQSLWDWAEQHPEFSDALSQAKTLEQAWWEKQGRDGLMIKGFNALVWHKSMAAKFRDDYTEKVTTEISGPKGGPVQVEASTIDPRNMTPEQRAALKLVMQTLKEGK